MFLNTRGNGVASTGTPAPGPAHEGGRPVSPRTPGTAPAPSNRHDASGVGFGAMTPLTEAVDAASVEPRPARYALMERVYDGLSAVKDALGRLPPLAIVGEAEFCQSLTSAFQGLDLKRVIAQLGKLIGMRSDIDREGLSQLKDELVALDEDLGGAPVTEPDCGHRQALSELQSWLTEVVSSLEDMMTASLAADAETGLATGRSGIEVPPSDSLPLSLHHGIQGLQTIFDKALATKATDGPFEAFMRLRRDLQEFDIFRFGEDLADEIDIRSDVLDLLIAHDRACEAWDAHFDRTRVEERWSAIERAIGNIAAGLAGADGTHLETEGPQAAPSTGKPKRYINFVGNEDVARHLRAINTRLSNDEVVERMAAWFSHGDGLSELAHRMGGDTVYLQEHLNSLSWASGLGHPSAPFILHDFACLLATHGIISWEDAVHLFPSEHLGRADTAPARSKSMTRTVWWAWSAMRSTGSRTGNGSPPPTSTNSSATSRMRSLTRTSKPWQPIRGSTAST